MFASRPIRVARVLLAFAVAPAFSGCGGGGGGGEDEPPPRVNAPPPAPSSGTFGRFVGTVQIEGVERYADALITAEGALSLHIGDPYSPTGVLPGGQPREAARVDAAMTWIRGGGVGSGGIMGERCGSAVRSRFCDAAMLASVEVEIDGTQLRGQIVAQAGAVRERYPLLLQAWDHYNSVTARTEMVAGQYQELLAEFAAPGDTVVNIDGTGRLFFQSASSGCAGNGTVVPHGDGRRNLYDVSLTIAGCTAQYAYLNTEFFGYSTMSPSSYWNYDTLLVAWLGTTEGAATSVALTLRGARL